MNQKTKRQLIEFIVVLAVVLILGVLTRGRWLSPATGGETGAQVTPTAQETQEEGAAVKEEETKVEGDKQGIDKNGTYTDKDNVALYIHTYGHLPSNYITKEEADKLGWDSKKGNLQKIATGKSIGGSHFGNYDETLPDEKGRKYKECDIDYEGGHRNAKRIIFSNDGLIFYTGDHYENFEQLY